MIRVLISVELGPYGPVIFFFNDTATTEIYTLSLHDALPIYERTHLGREPARPFGFGADLLRAQLGEHDHRSEEHTSELQSPCNLVCRLLLEKKKPLSTLRSTNFVRHRSRGATTPCISPSQYR